MKEIKKIVVYMKTGRKFTHFSESFDERDAVEALKAETFGLETYKGGFAAYNRKDIERIEIVGTEKN